MFRMEVNLFSRTGHVFSMSGPMLDMEGPSVLNIEFPELV